MSLEIRRRFEVVIGQAAWGGNWRGSALAADGVSSAMALRSDVYPRRALRRAQAHGSEIVPATNPSLVGTLVKALARAGR